MSDHRRPFGDGQIGDPGYGDEQHGGYGAEGYGAGGYRESGYGESRYGDEGFVTSRFTSSRFGDGGSNDYSEPHTDGAYGSNPHGGYEHPVAQPDRFDDAPRYDNADYGHAGYEQSGYEHAGYEDARYEGAGYDSAPVDAGSTSDFVNSERSLPEEIPAGTPRSRPRRKSAKSRRARRGKLFGIAAAALVFVVLAGLVVVGGKAFFGGPDLPADYAGPGGPDVVVQVHPGDTAEEIAESMVDKGVVASSAAFYNAAVQNEGMNSMQPGFYSISSEIPGVDAVSQLVDPTSRVGQMVISEGRQLHDNSDVQTGAVKKGIYTLISEASCTGAGDTKSCISYDDLNKAGATTDLDSLGVPDWAKNEVANVPDRDRQLEGLIAAGSWDFDPAAGAEGVLERLVTESAASYEKTGIETAGDKVGLTPYELLISASLVEREALPDDFPKVARVIVNRLAVNQPLQFDSTVNYALDTTELATTDEDRGRVTPWNTYASPGLPATPIAAPSIGALEATESPEPGDWVYFVTIDAQGTTLFTKSYEEHLSNIDHALNAGILTSGR